MSSSPIVRPPKRARQPHPGGEPVWDLAYLYPPQGQWSEEAYLALPGSLPIEFIDGTVEVLTMPTLAHQFIVLYLYRLLREYVQAYDLGWVLTAPLPVRLRRRVYREPDIVFLSADRPERRSGDYPEGADLVMEVVSGGHEDRRRDLVVKRAEYAAAGIDEYWIVDPDEKTVTVLRLEGDQYLEYGRFTDGKAQSALMPGFSVSVADIWTAAQG
jgi:Uma2 family endonuclease